MEQTDERVLAILKRRREILAEFAKPANAGRGAIQIKGQMVERLHQEMARRTVEIAEAIAAMKEG